MSNTNYVINHCKKGKAPTAGGNCSMSNVVYGAECLKHKQLYVDTPPTQFTFNLTTMNPT